MVTKNRSANLPKGLLGDRRSARLREAMARAGVRIDESGRGQIKTKGGSASVVLEPDGFITVRTSRAGFDIPPDPRAILKTGTLSHGNARFARHKARYRMAAETRVDGIDHLPESLDEILNQFRSMMTGRHPRKRRSDPVPDPVPDAAVAVRRSVESQGWTSEHCVETDYGWELQTRLAGRAVPVEVRAEESGIHVTRCVLSSLPTDDLVGRVVAHQALLFNDRLRFARLAVVDGQLVAETRVRAGLIDPDWLEFSSRAVASAAAGVTSTMRVLAEEDVLSRPYAEMFFDA